MAQDFDHMAEDAVRMLELLCRQPSVSAEGEALEETAELVQQLLAGAGFETQQLQVEGAAPAVYGEQPGRSDFTLLLYNHYDVQPVDPLELWDSPPFEPTLRDGKLFARGSVDDKGQLFLHIKALEAHLSSRGSLPVNVIVLAEGEEEVGSEHLAEFIEE